MIYVLIVSAVAVGFCINALMDMLAFEARGPMNGDAFIYLTVGRGILNGLTPYLQIFESKPPGIFALMALSLSITGTEAFARWLSIILLFSMPILLAFWMWKRGTTARLPILQKILGTVFGFLTGGLIALRLEQIVGSLQTEVFGVGFGFFFVLIILWNHERWRLWKSVAAGILMMFALFLKEPFLLAFIAIALLIDRHPRDYLRDLIIPGAVAGALMLLILLLTGWWHGYAEQYLPAMVLQRITAPNTGNPSLLYRALWTGRFFDSLGAYSPVPLLGPILVGCLALTFIRKRATDSIGDIILFVVTVMMTVYGLTYFIIMKRVAIVLINDGISPDQFWKMDIYRSWMEWIYAYWTVNVLLLAGIAWRRARMLPDIAVSIAAVALLCLAFGIGGYTGNDAAFPFPAYIAVAMIFLESTFLLSGTSRVAILQKILGTATAMIILVTLITFQPVPQSTRDQFFGERDRYQSFSQWLDRLLTACSDPPYFWYGGQPAMAYATHSPVGPIFTPYFHDYLTFHHPLYLDTYDNLRRSVKVLLIEKYPYKGTTPIPPDILGLFGPDAPACAKDVEKPPMDVQVLYRK